MSIENGESLHGEEVLFVPCSFERLLYFLTAFGTDEVVAMAYSSLVYSNSEVRRQSSFIGRGAFLG